MNARTCLLCGKSLSRIWVGAGQDFCSREHRNQYRLRRGMDRLQEANKVASLMRRRENPKALACLQQPGNFAPRPADSSQIRLSVRRHTSVLPASKWSPAVRIPESRGWVDGYHKPLPDAKPRAFGISWRQLTRIQLKETSRRVDSPAAQYLDRIRQPRSLPLPPQKGQLLRVSEGAGFRLPAMRSKEFRRTVLKLAIRWQDGPRAQALSSFDCPAAYHIPFVSFRLPELCPPSFAAPAYRTVIGARGPIHFEQRPAASDGLVRASSELWSNWETAMPRPIPYAGERMPAPDFVSLRQRLSAGRPTQHMVLMPLLPEDRAFGYVPTVATIPVRISGVPRPNLEEQFDSGLQNWTGGVEDWVIDAAGVRPGSLALFIPTFEKRDYEMEFLTYIEKRSVSWVFRASGLNDYQRATIAIGADGRYEFAHGTVLRGVPEFAPAEPVGTAIHQKKVLTVRLRAVGSEFTVWLDGQLAESWSDSRFPKGSIGFMGAPDDRARIYWVRLSSEGSQGKEYSKR